MLYLTCTTITGVGLAYYGVSRAEDWVSVDCGTSTVEPTAKRSITIISTARCTQTLSLSSEIQKVRRKKKEIMKNSMLTKWRLLYAGNIISGGCSQSINFNSYVFKLISKYNQVPDAIQCRINPETTLIQRHCAGSTSIQC